MNNDAGIVEIQTGEGKIWNSLPMAVSCYNKLSTAIFGSRVIPLNIRTSAITVHYYHHYCYLITDV